MDQDRVALLLAGAWLLVALATRRRPRLAVPAAALALAWLAAAIWPVAALWHRAALLHLLLSGGARWPRSWAARALIVVASVVAVVPAAAAVPWAWLGLAAALPLAAAAERRHRSVTRSRLPAWRAAAWLAALAIGAPALLRLLQLPREWSLAVLLGYAMAQALIAGLILLAARAEPHWATDLAVEVGDAQPRLERALRSSVADGAQDDEAREARATARRLRARLDDRAAALAAVVAATERSAARLAAADARERQALRAELEVVAVERLARAVESLPVALDGDAGASLARGRELLLDAIRELDALGRGLQPHPLDDGLVSALRRLADTAPIPVALTLPDEDALPPVRDEVALAVYYVAAEAIANAVKHARATTLRMRLCVDDGVDLRIDDDGVGGASDAPAGGLAGMRERASAVGGTLALDSASGAGTSIVMTVPGALERS
ncbi:sensor histidine kinase [Agrococcus carbonis]|uniref:histidine kinase n=1 Tax=Agrococcus carbonis TaxID=684552 RepID=A0A1H1SR97_9MICO|nr:ATP-binding protein [Agrococcus carbonis]SDS50512.1 Signal transduction histidine kinase [Agrococcus carbonis]